MRYGSALACLAAAPLLVAASKPVRLQPSSSWVLDYATDSCKLSRAFGSGKDATVLQFESTAPQQMSMIAIGKPLKTDLKMVPAKFLPGTGAIGGQPETATDGQPAIMWPEMPLLPMSYLEQMSEKAKRQERERGVRPPPIDLNERAAERAARDAFAAATTELEMDTHWNRPVILETGSLAEPIKMFDKCSRDSLRDWGVDPDLEDKIVRRPWAANPQQWFSVSDYPRDLRRQNKVSEIKVRLLVDAAGNPTKCTSLSNFDEPKFNELVCGIFMKRAKFEPAEFADGTKVPSYYINRVVFRLEP
jgi:hypothetical protein